MPVISYLADDSGQDAKDEFSPLEFPASRHSAMLNKGGVHLHAFILWELYISTHCTSAAVEEETREGLSCPCLPSCAKRAFPDSGFCRAPQPLKTAPSSICLLHLFSFSPPVFTPLLLLLQLPLPFSFPSLLRISSGCTVSYARG
eukprot:TRINITY_DN120_c0_g1_i1.p1 TRINITY_DN120_c0_g1~~TRINITY_DN120_c0_g1_i1.p1  ORF type:complete len:145 (-),score=10.12 TRINITY_DN120_c0_g1_i1:267-701(-)